MELLKLNDYLNLEARKVIEYFIEISKIPRKSGKEKKIREYIEEFAKKRNLKFVKDEYENIIVYKNATKGREDEETIALQAHTDMICEKNIGINHDFSKDQIILYKEGDYITANGTTLGADNGIGVAYMLAILDSEISIPNLECIFTVQEETTMLGVIKIDEKNIKARKIISLDNGKEGKILVSSANCNEWIGIVECEKNSVPDNMKLYRLKYENFPGGHSGGNIGDEKRGNPIKLAMSTLENVRDIQIAKLEGGSRVNVIPREFCIEFYTFSENENKINEIIKLQKKKFKNEAIALEKIEIESSDIKKNKSYSVSDSRKIIDFVNRYKNGALKREENGDVILSANLAVINECNNGIQIEFSERSNKKELEREYLKKLSNLIKEYDINIIWKQELKGVEKKQKNDLLNKCQNVYMKLFNKKMEEVVSQGVVEGGFFANKIIDCEYICIGPNTYDVHSPKEKLSISSTNRIWKYLIELLSNINFK